MTNQLQQGNNTLNPAPYQQMLPFDVGVRIEAEEAVRLMLELTERLDYNELHASYDRMPRQTEASPKQMFQLIILGFM
ncbi:MAG: hypothetical protein FWC93_08475 [Defluviitaleaceae bacterium]|nr:hypothetical protein [Defluviitaleaceae bacterium]